MEKKLTKHFLKSLARKGILRGSIKSHFDGMTDGMEMIDNPVCTDWNLDDLDDCVLKGSYIRRENDKVVHVSNCCYTIDFYC